MSQRSRIDFVEQPLKRAAPAISIRNMRAGSYAHGGVIALPDIDNVARHRFNIVDRAKQADAFGNAIGHCA